MSIIIWEFCPSTQPLNLDFPFLENGITLLLKPEFWLSFSAITLLYLINTLHLVNLESICIAYMIIWVKLSSFPSLPSGLFKLSAWMFIIYGWLIVKTLVFLSFTYLSVSHLNQSWTWFCNILLCLIAFNYWIRTEIEIWIY